MFIEQLKINNAPDPEINIVDFEAYRIDPNVIVEKPIPILSVNDGYRDIDIFTEDNISMTQGKAKSRKSAWIRSIAIAIQKGSYNVLKSSYHRNQVAIFDTEQGQYDCWLSARMIKNESGFSVDYFSVNNLNANDRKMVVEMYLKNNPECGFVIIDNIVHLMKDFNSATESSDLIDWLGKIRGDFNVHIHVVLHENGGTSEDGKARGHLGTSLENTCETIIRVKINNNDKTQSIVMAKATRGMSFNPILLEMDNQRVPYLSLFDETSQPVIQKRY